MIQPHYHNLLSPDVHMLGGDVRMQKWLGFFGHLAVGAKCSQMTDGNQKSFMASNLKMPRADFYGRLKLG